MQLQSALGLACELPRCAHKLQNTRVSGTMQANSGSASSFVNAMLITDCNQMPSAHLRESSVSLESRVACSPLKRVGMIQADWSSASELRTAVDVCG